MKNGYEKNHDNFFLIEAKKNEYILLDTSGSLSP
jgi:hypothetical protein